MKFRRGSWKGFLYRKFKGDILFERIGNRFEFLICICKLFCKYGVLDVICILYADAIWGLYYAYIDIGYLRTFVVGHRELLVDPRK